MKHVRLTTLVAAALVLAPALAASPEEILDAFRVAAGGDALKGKAAMETEADIVAYGMTGTVHSLSDMKTGRNVNRVKLGPIANADGFDGKVSWDMDQNGVVTIREGGDAKEQAANLVYMSTSAWWRPDRGGAKLAASEKTADGKTYDVVTITPPGGLPFDAWFDRDSHLVARTVLTEGGRTTTTTLSDYAALDGVMLAKKTIVDSGAGPQYLMTMTVTKVAFVAMPPDEDFAPPKAKTGDSAIAGGATETSLPFKLVNNHIYGQVKVNGKGPITAIFDTGGVNLVTPATAAAVGLKIEGKLPASGAGEGTMEAGLAKADTIEVAGATVRDQTIIVLPLDSMEHVEGMPMPAMVGYETFRRFVTRIDYGKGVITLIDPAHFDPADAGTPIPFTFNAHHPEVQGTFEGLPAKFDIDTGARNDLTLNKPFVERNGLVAKHPKGVYTVDGWGVGGPSTGYATRGTEMTIGSMKVDNIVVSMADQAKGAFAGDEYQGNIGGGILKRFVVTFDYGNKIMYLKPLAKPPGEIGTYDRAGMWINRDPEGFAVVAVTKGGPAEAAGVMKGDVIVAVGGKQATGIALPDMRARLRTAKPGSTIVFELLRSGKRKTVHVTLRDLI